MTLHHFRLSAMGLLIAAVSAHVQALAPIEPSSSALTALGWTSYSTGTMPTVPDYTINMKPLVYTTGTESGQPYIEYEFASIHDTPFSTLAQNQAQSNIGAMVLALGAPFTVSDGQTSLYRLFSNMVLTPLSGSYVSPQAEIKAELIAYPDVVENQVEQFADNAYNLSQSVQRDVYSGTKNAKTGTTISTLQPVLAIENVAPGEKFRVRLYLNSMQLTRFQMNQSVVHVHDAPQTVRDPGTIKLTAHVQLSSYDTSLPTSSTNYTAVFELVNGWGTVTPVGSQTVSLVRPAAGTTTPITIAWQGTVPVVSSGTQQVRFRLVPPSSTKGMRLGLNNTTVGAEFGSASATTGYTYRLGTLTSAGDGGIQIGTSSSRYPSYYDDAGVLNSGASLYGSTYDPATINFNMIRTNRKMPAWSASVSGGTTLVFDPSSYTAWGAGMVAPAPYSQITLAAWANHFHPNVTTPGKRRLLVNLYGSPYEASSAPSDYQNASGQGGLAAPLTANGTTVFNAFLTRLMGTTETYRNRLHALECSNEPNDPAFWTGTKTQLADACKAVHTRRAAASLTSVPIICPQTDSPSKLGYVLSAKTSAGESILNFCDWVGAHTYVGTGSDSNGQPNTVQSVAEQVRMMRKRMATWGASAKPLVITEYGVGPLNTPYNGKPALNALSSAQRGNLLFQSLVSLQEAGVKGVTLYGYDVHTDISTGGVQPFGFLLNIDPPVTPGGPRTMNATVINRLKDAINFMSPP